MSKRCHFIRKNCNKKNWFEIKLKDAPSFLITINNLPDDHWICAILPLLSLLFPYNGLITALIMTSDQKRVKMDTVWSCDLQPDHIHQCCLCNVNPRFEIIFHNDTLIKHRSSFLSHSLTGSSRKKTNSFKLQAFTSSILI